MNCDSVHNSSSLEFEGAIHNANRCKLYVMFWNNKHYNKNQELCKGMTNATQKGEKLYGCYRTEIPSSSSSSSRRIREIASSNNPLPGETMVANRSLSSFGVGSTSISCSVANRPCEKSRRCRRSANFVICNASKKLPPILFRRRVSVSPADEKTRSQGTADAWMGIWSNANR